MADNFGGGENIFFTDDSNIVVIDPNSIIDSRGAKKDRVIKQENLVMYANLEVSSVPRTRLVLGQSVDSGISNVSLASINFMKPQGKTTFDTSYTDQYTGGRNSQGRINEISFDRNLNPQQNNYVDTQLLGIKNISVDIKFNGVPEVSMTLVDIQGKALFEVGGNSPYSVFMYYPYPTFFLTLKGFYGKAVKYELMLRNFNASFESSSGNYNIDLKFIARTSAILDDVRLGYLFALPNMYPIYETSSSETPGTSQSATASLQQIGTDLTQNLTTVKTSKGYNKLKQVFEIYRNEGLIDKQVPTLTLDAMVKNLSKYTQFLNDEFNKLDFSRLVSLRKYQISLDNYKKDITKFKDDNLDKKDVIVLTDGTILYGLKGVTPKVNSSDQTTSKSNNEKYEKANDSLKNTQTTYETQLTSLNPWGTEITTPDNFYELSIFQKEFTENTIDFQATYKLRTSVTTVNLIDLAFIEFKKRLVEELTLKDVIPQPAVNEPNKFYYTFGEFDNGVSEVSEIIGQNDKIENEKLNTDLQSRVKSNPNVTNLPFIPTIRNVMGVILAQVDAFYRLMDDVHVQAWGQRNNPSRIRSIISNGTPSQEGKNSVSTTTSNPSNFVYPWPQFVQKQNDRDKSEYHITYPGSRSVSKFTNGYDKTIWPEVEFVEQFLYALTVRDLDYPSNTKTAPSLSLKYTPSSAIEFAYRDRIYREPEIFRFVYEMYERILLNTFYSGFHYTKVGDELIFAGSDMEVNNIVKDGTPEGKLREVLQNVLPSQTLYDYLKSTSNNQSGDLWNDFIAQSYITQYIKERVDESTELYSETQFKNLSKKPVRLESQNAIENILSAQTSSELSLMDTYPFRIQSFQEKMVQTNGTRTYDTINTYNLDSKNLFVSNQKNPIKPLTKVTSSLSGFSESDINHNSINVFFNQRFLLGYKRLITESNLSSDNINLTTTQTTSLLNTPYFLNSIMKSSTVTEDIKYTEAAYLLLNSLPLSTFYERYLDTTNGKPDDYIFASINKYSAIHKVPLAWILKIGSIWHRYKKYVETGVDFLDSVWKDFDYKKAYDPTTSNVNTVYQILKDNSSSKTDYKLNETNSINTGFYPGLYNSFFKILTGTELFANNDVNSQTIEFWKENLKIYTDTKTSSLDGAIQPHYSTFFVNSKYGPQFGPSNIGKSVIMPSAGYLPFNQTYFELTSPGTKSANLPKSQINVTPMYNGSARFFWESPNYGWFDTSKYTKPNYDEYLKIIEKSFDREQYDFNLGKHKYIKIEDLFGVFQLEELNKFETEFLEFCKDESGSALFLESTNDESFTSFKELLKKMMLVDVGIEYDPKKISNLQSVNINNVLTEFLNINTYLKIGNPKKFDRLNFGYFITPTTSSGLNNMVTTVPKPYGEYVKNTLPGSGQTVTLAESQNKNPKAWTALKLNVGISTIKGIEFTEKSYVYDFFIDNNVAFTEENVIKLSKLIKVYATQKKLNETAPDTSTYNSNQFNQDLTTLMNDIYTRRTAIENQIRTKIPGALINNQNTQDIIINRFEGDSTKLEMWELFKALNDKWVAGVDFKEKIIFEEFLFFDRANRDIGNDYIINVDSISKYCSWSNSNTSVMTLIRQLLVENKMNFFVMPAYVNFYGRPSKRYNSRNETIMNNANDVFSAFGYVDTTQSAPKFLCQYIGKPSNTLSMDNDPQYPFKSDSFDLGVSAGNPIRNTSTRFDKYTNNKAVGFVVDFGATNQSVFKSIDITQNQNITSSEQIQTVVDMGQLGANKKTSQQTFNLFELYKNRTYDCTLKTFGNAMLQPTMYFILRHMPMFNGTYIIRNVKHTIGPGSFNTEVTGQRLSSMSNSKILDSLAALNEDFTQKLDNQIKELVQNNTLVVLNSRTNAYLTGQEAKDQNIKDTRIPYQGDIVDANDSEMQTCGVNIWGYDTSDQSKKLTNLPFQSNTISYESLVSILKTETDVKMRLFLYSLFYLTGYDPERIKYDVKLSNLYGATGDIRWNSVDDVEGYRCLLTSQKSAIPYLKFRNPQTCVKFTSDYFQNLLTKYIQDEKEFPNTTNINWTNITKANLADSTITNTMAVIFTTLFYDYWYTGGNSAVKAKDANEFSTWLSKVNTALFKASKSKLI